jgi:uncharacterized protein (TIGR03083 family)
MNRTASSLGPILVADLFPKIEAKLIELLRSLTPEEWERQTISPKWKVKDVAAHLLDTHLRKLSLARDGCFDPTVVIRSEADLIALINRLNEEGVRIYRRLSPAVLIELMEVAARESAEYHESLDPFAKAAFGVSWAGEETSLNWFDTVRELTERWHHQQQIREAVDRPGIMTRELYYPVLDCFMRGLPHAFRDVKEGKSVEVVVSGDCGGTWWMARDGNWKLVEKLENPETKVTIPQEIAWRVFTKGIPRSEALERVTIEGDPGLGMKVLGLTAIVG